MSTSVTHSLHSELGECRFTCISTRCTEHQLVLQECGADCAKFQKSELEYKFNKKALERPYTSKHSWGKTYGEHKRHLEFSHDQYRELKKYAEEIGIFFTASGMDEVCKPYWSDKGSDCCVCWVLLRCDSSYRKRIYGQSISN